MRAAVVITTKNRKADLRQAIASALQQTAVSEVVVVDDGSTDQTSEMVRSEFPQVKLEQSSASFGYITQRNRAAGLSSADVIISIDDDATFSSPRVVEEAISAFGHPRVAAIAIPYTEPHKSDRVFQRASDDKEIWVTDFFRGTAHAVRREVFVALGGYREQLVHQGEESDFCIRLLEQGFVVRLGWGDHIIHHEAANRDWSRMDYYGRRNDILFVWHNVPWLFFLPHLVGTTSYGVRWAGNARSIGMVRGTISGYRDSARFWAARAPVSIETYRLHRALRKRGPRLLSEIEQLLPSINLNIPAAAHLAASSAANIDV